MHISNIISKNISTSKNIFIYYKYLIIFSFISILTAGCSTPGRIISTDKDNYGLIVNSSYNGTLITLDKSTKSFQYKGRIFYFANSADMQKFQDSPEKYIAMHDFNKNPKKIKPYKSDYGLKTDSSYNGDPIVITEFSPTLEFLGRIFYFAHQEETYLFIMNPLVYIAKYPANKVPRTISPLKSDYGKKSICAATGTPILIGPHTPSLEYLGRVFYFSSLYDMQAFQQDPQAYVAKDFNQQ